MPPKSSSKTVEDILEALLDTRVGDALAKALTPFLTLSINEILDKKLEGLTAAVRDLKGANTRLTQQCESVAKENASLKKLVSDQSYRIDDLESYSRSENLVIRGLPEKSAAEMATASMGSDGNPLLLDGSKSVENTVIAFCKDSLGIELSSADISIAHRLKAGQKDEFRPVIVRFTSRKMRNTVYGAKKQLKNRSGKVYISEHLTKTASDLFFDARKLLREKKIFAAWTQNGQVFARLNPDQNSRPSIIKTRADLNIRP